MKFCPVFYVFTLMVGRLLYPRPRSPVHRPPLSRLSSVTLNYPPSLVERGAWSKKKGGDKRRNYFFDDVWSKRTECPNVAGVSIRR